MIYNILTVISCHTDSIIKINALLHNLKYFMEISTDIAIVNSSEFINLNLEKKIKDKYFDKNIVFNDIITDELCFAYKNKYADLKNLNNNQLRNHWINIGKKEKRIISVLKNNIYFDYKENDKFICHGKFIYYLNKIDYSNYDNIILTNDSFIITRSLFDFKNLIDKNTELVSLLDSNDIKYHYPDFLRAYNYVGIKKILEYYEKNKKNISDFLSTIINYEINSSELFNDVKILYKNENNYIKNIHYDNDKLEDYLYNKNYPVIKLKKFYGPNTYDGKLPEDFNPNEYKNLYSDLCNFSDIDALNHFINHGMYEGRYYKKNQICILPKFLENYLILIGFLKKN